MFSQILLLRGQLTVKVLDHGSAVVHVLSCSEKGTLGACLRLDR